MGVYGSIWFFFFGSTSACLFLNLNFPFPLQHNPHTLVNLQLGSHYSTHRMPDYSKNKNYKLMCNVTGKAYYGHTTRTLEQREGQHIREATYVNRRYPCTSKQIIDGGDWEMIWLEDYPCTSKEEATARERWWIENNECVNRVVPGRTKKEYDVAHKAEKAVWHKAHYQAHKEEKAVYQKVYREWNRDMQGLNRIDITD